VSYIPTHIEQEVAMSQPDPDESREILARGGDEVVQPWEERATTIEAGLDDTTAPGLDETDAGRGRPSEEDVSDRAGALEPPD
jgi:hypothetical protein